MVAIFRLVWNASKIAGTIAALSATANVIAYIRFRDEFLFPLPSDTFSGEDEETEASFDVEKSEEEEEGAFFFGLATAPAHAEDKLHDAWLEFAMQNEEEEHRHPGEHVQEPSLRISSDLDARPSKAAMDAVRLQRKQDTVMKAPIHHHHNVAAWHNAQRPEERLRFWTDPDSELRLARDTGVTVFRMGVDWTRVMPVEPVNGVQKSVNWNAVKRYKWILERVHAYGMRVMLTLFHHSLPPWAGEYGGWKLEKTVFYFLEFTKIAVEHFSHLVDYWVTFNEPHVFAMLTYCAGTWPGGHPGLLEVATAAMPKGVYNQVMHWMTVAHSKAYDHIHDFSKSLKTRVGIAHHVSFMRPYGLFDVPAVILSISMTLFPYVDSICDKLDFLGINYYGQEVVSGPGLKLVDNDEYSESGRGVYPDGLYRMLLKFNERYEKLRLPFIITENGISDGTDLIRRPYLLEHLLAIRAAMDKGVRVLGYVFWTTSDNWEWADGYGPKFGLVAVDRANNLARIPRPSYFLFSTVAKTGKVTRKQREMAWVELQTAAAQGKTRPFYREVNKHGLMYAGGLDIPIQRAFVQRDWRFTRYQMDNLRDPLFSVFGHFFKTKSRTAKDEPQVTEALLQSQ